MPLPVADIAWPPAETAEPYAKMAEWAAWYSGEPSRLIDIYAGLAPVNAPTAWWRFWSRARVGSDGYQRALLHVPIASDLAGVSGSLLFGEPVKIRVRAEREELPPPAPDPVAPMAPPADPLAAPPTEGGEPGDEPAKPRKKPQSPEARAERAILDFAENGDLYAKLVEAAESAAAMGGVYIYPFWDKDLRDFPLMAIAQADQALPEFRHGFLTAVTFHRVVRVDGSTVYRHLERHEVEGTGETRKAVVLNALYVGGPTRLGTVTGLTSAEATARLAPRVELPFKELDVEYLPNIRPNRLWRASGLGVADIQGSETLLDALDETYASWMRDVRLAKARIIVPRDYLRPDEDGVPSFDIDQEIYTAMDMEPGLSPDARSMLAHQFAIRHLEHSATARDLVERIVSNAGYTPSTQSGVSATGTGTQLRISEHKTLLTLRKKSGWWRAAIANLLLHMQLINREIFGSTAPAIRPTILTADSIIDNPLELAQTALALKTAESASTETRVRLVHPDWSNAEVDAEVERIKADKPAPVVTPGAFGNPAQDPAATGNLPTTDQTKKPPTNPPPASPPFAPKAD